ncbi:protein of unknown function DUF264 [Candidatus Koribacter versatilis Ellin345]|uniref:Terminase large subunit gp17-like C-terminal domain-containing protein n=1 Tax=Koribacter versatilis (strain Ellin345) TaxID=204669 RepID=Q1IL43_KORVE|nr:terminase family protein [Candidatus Koribacter versatilis]ABF42407.1 protein of unknown function DUF264 [Candidatus Koribacter versatilis Ellin345]
MASQQREIERTASKALVKLYPYQVRWILDEGRFKLIVKGRQTGLSFGTSLRHVRRRIKTRGDTIWISASDRQSRESIEYCKTHAKAVGEAFDFAEIAFPGTDDKAQQITFLHNGARIIGLPANPDTVRGYHGDVVLDEFGFHRDAKKIYKAAIAIASRGYQLEVISTPNEQAGKFWEIAKAAGVPADGGSERTHWTKGVWSVHWLDIYTAVKEGCPIDVEVMRQACYDDDTWQQEYCCVFLADAQNYIPMELIIAAESQMASLDARPEDLAGRELYLGMDIGRKKDRTVIWIDEKLGDVMITRAVETLERTPFAKQFEQAAAWMPYVRRGCIDSTGIGAQIGEDLERKFGAAKVEKVEFNIANKETMAGLAKRKLEDRQARIPESPSIRRAINAVKRYTSPTGHFRFDADRTEAGHADEFWAFALCLSAAEGGSSPALASIDTDTSLNRARNGVDEDLVAAGARRERGDYMMGARNRDRRVW